jgi:hypothetical protein
LHSTEKTTSCLAQTKKLHLASPDRIWYISPPHLAEKATSRRCTQPKKLHFAPPDRKSYISPCPTEKTTSRLA